MIGEIPEVLNSTGLSATNQQFFLHIDANQPKAGTIDRPFHPWARWAQMVLQRPLSSTGGFSMVGRKEGCPGQTTWHCILRMFSPVHFEYLSFSNSDGFILHNIDHPSAVMHVGRIKFRICGTIASLQIAGVIHILTNSSLNLIAKPKIYGDVFQFCPFGASWKTQTVTGGVKCNHGPNKRTRRKKRTCNNHSRATRVSSVAEIFIDISASDRGDFWA